MGSLGISDSWHHKDVPGPAAVTADPRDPTPGSAVKPTPGRHILAAFPDCSLVKVRLVGRADIRDTGRARVTSEGQILGRLQRLSRVGDDVFDAVVHRPPPRPLARRGSGATATTQAWISRGRSGRRQRTASRRVVPVVRTSSTRSTRSLSRAPGPHPRRIRRLRPPRSPGIRPLRGGVPRCASTLRCGTCSRRATSRPNSAAWSTPRCHTRQEAPGTGMTRVAATSIGPPRRAISSASSRPRSSAASGRPPYLRSRIRRRSSPENSPRRTTPSAIPARPRQATQGEDASPGPMVPPQRRQHVPPPMDARTGGPATASLASVSSP